MITLIHPIYTVVMSNDIVPHMVCNFRVLYPGWGKDDKTSLHLKHLGGSSSSHLLLGNHWLVFAELELPDLSCDHVSKELLLCFRIHTGL